MIQDDALAEMIQQAIESLPSRLKLLRGDRSQRQFAQDVGELQQNISRWESGQPARLSGLLRLALAERVTLDWLLLGQGDPHRG